MHGSDRAADLAGMVSDRLGGHMRVFLVLIDTSNDKIEFGTDLTPEDAANVCLSTLNAMGFETAIVSSIQKHDPREN